MSSKRPIIDCDIHNTLVRPDELFPYLSSYWRHQLKTNGFPVTPSSFRSPVGVIRADAGCPDGAPAASSPAYLIEHHMDPNGITYGVLTGDQMGVSVQADVDFANELASAYNDNLKARWLDFSDRYRGSIIVNHSDPVAAAKEIDRVAPDKRFVQVAICSGARILFGQRHYYPMYEAAERHGLPIALHPGAEGVGTTGAPTPSGYPSLYFEWHNILPINYMAHVNSLVCEGVFEKFPGLKFIGLEGGISWVPHLMWRMDKNYKALRSMTPWLKRLPSEYILDHIRLSTQPMEEPPRASDLLAMFEMMQGDRMLVFSSDYAHWDGDDPHHILGSLPEPAQQRIFWQNAADLYHLSPPSPAKADDHVPALSRL
jgi:predicted TIM-barrel fold metal-dependent hydrolase